MPELLRYPDKKITSSDDYLQIDVLEYKAPGLGSGPSSFGLNSSDTTYANVDNKIANPLSIILPIPESILDNNSAAWSASNSAIGPAEAYLAGFSVETIGDPKSVVNNAKERFGKALTAAGSAMVQQGFQSGAVALAVRAVLNDDKGQKYLERGAGITFNQNIELLFTGVNMRSEFRFSFDMIPRSQRESNIIKNIIRSFKKYSAVKKGLDGHATQGLFLKAPEVFRIRYMSGGKPHPFLNKFKICALVNMSVDYTGEGTYSTYSDATPVNIILNLAFQELTPIYYEDYLTTGEGGSDDGIGVGY